MTRKHTVFCHAALIGLVTLSSGCVVHEGSSSAAREEGYREGYYDREHSRYYHDKSWHDCLANDPYCR
jgi:hypothetical protein